MVLIRVHPRRRLSVRYTPPPIIADAVDRFWAKTQQTANHRLWTGRPPAKHHRPVFQSKGAMIYIHDFAYRTYWGDIWPGLKAVPVCGHALCVEPLHLKLARAGSKPFAPLTEAQWDCIAELMYDRGDRAPHPHLVDSNDVAAAYGLEEDLAYRELTSRVHYAVGKGDSTFKSGPDSFDAARIAQP